MLKGIDISNHQKGIDLSKVNCDFVIMKATEGKSYVDPSCNTFFQQALSLGKKLGIYHFANNSDNTAEQEAEWFITNTRGYVGKAIPVLDWEDSGYTNDVAWALKWLQLVEEAYGCKPLIYMSESVVNANDWSSVANSNYGLWVAKYRDNNADYNYDMSSVGNKPSVKHWSFYAIWQWTSSGRLDGYNGNLDCDEFYGDTSAWDKYVGTSETEETQDGPATSYAGPIGDHGEILLRTMKGEFGNGKERVENLGPRYAEIQNEINYIATANANTLAEEVKAGKYGNGETRKVLLGTRYEEVQKIVNGSYTKTYTVKSGDTLSEIGQKLGVNWKDIASKNGISSPYTIYPGQVLKI